jgi:hypothetical protein
MNKASKGQRFTQGGADSYFVATANIHLPAHYAGWETCQLEMKLLLLSLFSAVVLLTQPLQAGGPYYGGGHHTSSHGGHYSGASGSSHRGGHYKNAKTHNHYGRHK